MYYKEITPRIEKGEPVHGHLFGFEYIGTGENDNESSSKQEL